MGIRVPGFVIFQFFALFCYDNMSHQQHNSIRVKNKSLHHRDVIFVLLTNTKAICKNMFTAEISKQTKTTTSTILTEANFIYGLPTYVRHNNSNLQERGSPLSVAIPYFCFQLEQVAGSKIINKYTINGDFLTTGALSTYCYGD